jgi:hypothetical protein
MPVDPPAIACIAIPRSGDAPRSTEEKDVKLSLMSEHHQREETTNAR